MHNPTRNFRTNFKMKQFKLLRKLFQLVPLLIVFVQFEEVDSLRPRSSNIKQETRETRRRDSLFGAQPPHGELSILPRKAPKGRGLISLASSLPISTNNIQLYIHWVIQVIGDVVGEVVNQVHNAIHKNPRQTSVQGQNANDEYALPCVPKSFNRGSFVCVCNATYCDRVKLTLPGGPGTEEGNVQLFTSTKSSFRFHKSIVQFNNDPGRPSANSGGDIFDLFTPKPEKMTNYTINRGNQFQKILGYGGAFTDAAGINIGKLSQAAQENLMKSYFGQDGIDYSMGRVPIGGTDFSTRAYTYNDGIQSEDIDLVKFQLQMEDHKYKIPYIHQAKSLSDHDFKIFASPWSAPSWMKTNGKLTGYGQLKKKYYQVWADYFVKFLKSYQDEDIPIWGITTGNEPANGYVPFWPFNCMGWTSWEMRDFIGNYLGPTLKTAGLDPRVIILDDNKKYVNGWAREIIGRQESGQYVHGIGTHWYLDFLVPSDVLSEFHRNYPDQIIMQTEACLGFAPWELEKVSLGNWERGETYLEAIIKDSHNFFGAWIDWNLALDLKGGPNWANFKADAAILVKESSDEFYKQPMYYGLGHISKFVPPDSTRIEIRIETRPRDNLLAVAFQRPDDGIVIAFLNKFQYDAQIRINDPSRGSLFFNIPAKAFQTLIYW